MRTSTFQATAKNTLPNPILLKDQQGKVKQPVYQLPASNHTYGKKINDDPQPIKYVINGWKQASSSKDPQSIKKNYQALNKMALKQKLITAKEQQQFRKTNNVMVQSKKGQKVMPILLPQQQFTYGVPNRPSTPVKLVIGNCYGLQKQRQNQQKYMRQTFLKQQQKNKKLQAAKTKSQLLREQTTNQQKQYRQKPNIQEKFKLSKYTKSNTSKIDTGINFNNSFAQSKA